MKKVIKDRIYLLRHVLEQAIQNFSIKSNGDTISEIDLSQDDLPEIEKILNALKESNNE